MSTSVGRRASSSSVRIDGIAGGDGTGAGTDAAAAVTTGVGGAGARKIACHRAAGETRIHLEIQCSRWADRACTSHDTKRRDREVHRVEARAIRS